MTIIVYGLADFEGQTLAVFLAGLDTGDYPVVNAQISVPTDGTDKSGLLTVHYLLQVSAMPRDWGVHTLYSGGFRVPCITGYRYSSRGQIVRPIEAADVGSFAGPGFGKFKRNHQAALLVSSTGPIRIGETFDRMHPILSRTPGEVAFSPTELVDGVIVDSVDGDSTYDGMLAWEISSPLSAKVCMVGGFIKTEDR